jgi:hypothetical protein
MADEYAEKMSRKPLSELRLYVQNRVEYREEAVLAALSELEKRGEQPTEAAAIRAELLPIVEQQRAAQVKTVAATPAADIVPGQAAGTEEGPALYSPGTIVLFSMLFSFFVGGILMTINMFKLKEVGKALRIMLFVAVMLGCYYYVHWAAIPNQTQMIISVVVQLVAIFAYLLYFWPRYVGARPYVSRQWLPAMFICLLIIGGLYFLLVSAGAAIPK